MILRPADPACAPGFCTAIGTMERATRSLPFADPAYLVLLLGVPLLAWWYVARDRSQTRVAALLVARRRRPRRPVCFHTNSAPKTQEFWPPRQPNRGSERSR